MRWWSLAGDHLGASLFVFPDRRSAAEYVTEAASARCRLAAVAARVAAPLGGRAVVWENPDGYLQTDVLFARANVVYRLVAVATGAQQGERPTRADLGRLLRLPDGLACALRDAGCPRSQVVPGRS
ncbi:MAG: hypothetical protein WB557_18060 [Solirubrobacteraceae bacterium]